MAIAYLTGKHYVLYAARGELAPWRKPRKRNNAYWCITAMMALADEESEQFPVTRWAFALELQPAVERLVAARDALLEIVDQKEAEKRVLDLITERADSLNAALRHQLQLDKQAALA